MQLFRRFYSVNEALELIIADDDPDSFNSADIVLHPLNDGRPSEEESGDEEDANTGHLSAAQLRSVAEVNITSKNINANCDLTLQVIKCSYCIWCLAISYKEALLE